MHIPELENGWSIATLRTELQMEFLKAAMKYVEGNWTYYIGGSNYQSTNNSDIQVTPLSYCASAYSINDPGNIILIFNIFCQYNQYKSCQLGRQHCCRAFLPT